MGVFSPGAGIIAGKLMGTPDMPELQKLSLAQEQEKAITANQGALPGLEKMAGGINQFNIDQLRKMYSQSIPGYEDMKASGSESIQKMMKGEIPISDMQQQQLRSVAKSFGTGTGGSGSMGNLVARDLGLAELDVINKGITSAQNWMQSIASLEKPQLFDFSSMFINPMQQYTTANEQNIQEFQHDWSKNQMDWKNSTGYLFGQEIQQDSAQMDSMIGSAVGSAAGGAAGGGGL